MAAALDPRTLQILMAMEPAAQQRQAMSGGVLAPNAPSSWMRARDAEPMPPPIGVSGGMPADHFTQQRGNLLSAAASGTPTPGPMPPQMDMPPPNRLAPAPTPAPAPAPMPAPDVEMTGSVTPPAAGNMLAPPRRMYDPAAGTNEPRFITPQRPAQGGPAPVAPMGYAAGPSPSAGAPAAPSAGGGGLMGGSFGDLLMGTLLGGGLRGGVKAMYLGGKEREQKAAEAQQTAGLRQAAIKMGMPADTVNYADGASLQSLVLDMQRQRVEGGAPKWAIKPLTNDKGEEQSAWVNENDPAVKPIWVGGAKPNEANKPQVVSKGGMIYENGQWKMPPQGAGGSQADFSDVAGVRKEIQGSGAYKTLDAAIPSYNSMVKSVDRTDRAADLDFIYGLAKIFDPTSVVREGEMVMMSGTASLPDWLVGQINKVNGGEGLTRDVRLNLLNTAKTRVGEYKNQFDQYADSYRGIADRYNINPDDILPRMADISEYKEPPTKTGDFTRDQAIEEARRRGLMK